MTERKIRKLLLSSIPLYTDRLELRYIELSDAYDMYDYASRPSVCEYLLWSPHLDLAATEGYIESIAKRYKKGLYADWAVALRDEGRMIGTCGYAAVNTLEKWCEIGYVLSPDYSKQGYMTEAVNAVLDLTFSVLDLNEARLRIMTENMASRRLAERVGFRLERIGYSEMVVKDRDRDIAHYLMTKEEYKRKKEAVI